jgi:NHLM bacteriocin system secretion protein
MTAMPSIFRPEALERFAAPDQLDQLMRVVNPKHWLVLVTFAALVVITLLWGVWGRLPTAVMGRGVLIRPHKVVDFQSPAAGRLGKLAIQVGDVVKTGDILGEIDQAEIRQQLRENRAKLQALLKQDQTKSALQTQHTMSATQQRILATQAIELQRQDVRKRLQDAQAKAPLLKQRLENRQRLEALGLLPKLSDEGLQAEQAYRENQNTMAELQTRLTQLEGELKQLDSQAKQLALEKIEASTSRTNDIQALRSQLALLEVQLAENSQIISQYTGRILEITAHVGQMVETGHRLGSVEVEDTMSRLISLTYFPIQAGKRIRAGMTIYVTPDTVARERFGSILGTVTSVSPFPVTKAGAASLVGNAEVADALIAQGPAIEVAAELVQDASTPSGYRWSSQGPALQITSSTTAVGRVVIEQRAPITYLIPLLRELSGIY